MSTEQNADVEDVETGASDEADDAMPEPTWPVTIKLKCPVQFGKELVEELTFQRGKLGYLKGIEVGGFPPVDKLMLIASRMCGQPVQVIERLDDEDGSEVLALAMIFFARCLPISRRR